MKTLAYLAGATALAATLASPAFAQMETTAGADAAGITDVNERMRDVQDDVQDDFDRSGYYGFANLDRQNAKTDALQAIFSHQFSDGVSVRNLTRYERVNQDTVTSLINLIKPLELVALRDELDLLTQSGELSEVAEARKMELVRLTLALKLEISQHRPISG